MKKLFPEAQDVPQPVANRAIRIVEKHMRLHKVDRARDLPEEAKVRLLTELRAFFEAERSEKETAHTEHDDRGWLTRVLDRVDRVLRLGGPA
jgi:hypothetical protein